MPASARRTALILTSTVLAAALSSCSLGADGSMPGMAHDAQHTVSTSTASSTSTAGDAAKAGDVMFAQMMIPHHRQAIEMSDLALATTGASPQVTALAHQIKGAQDPEISTMLAWLSTWGEAEPPATHMNHGDGMMTSADMSALRSQQGVAFDRLWLTMMIKHHAGAIDMADKVLKTTTNPDVSALARGIVSAQKSEIATMQALLETVGA